MANGGFSGNRSSKAISEVTLSMFIRTKITIEIKVSLSKRLKGFPEAIEAVFPKTKIQLCIIHQIRTSIRYVPEEDKKRLLEI